MSDELSNNRVCEHNCRVNSDVSIRTTVRKLKEISPKTAEKVEKLLKKGVGGCWLSRYIMLELLYNPRNIIRSP